MTQINFLKNCWWTSCFSTKTENWKLCHRTQQEKSWKKWKLITSLKFIRELMLQKNHYSKMWGETRDCRLKQSQWLQTNGRLFQTTYKPVGFPGDSVVKNPPISAGEAGDTGSIPGSGRHPGGGSGNPLQYTCPGNPMDRSLADYSPLGCK